MKAMRPAPIQRAMLQVRGGGGGGWKSCSGSLPAGRHSQHGPPLPAARGVRYDARAAAVSSGVLGEIVRQEGVAEVEEDAAADAVERALQSVRRRNIM